MYSKTEAKPVLYLTNHKEAYPVDEQYHYFTFPSRTQEPVSLSMLTTRLETEVSAALSQKYKDSLFLNLFLSFPLSGFTTSALLQARTHSSLSSLLRQVIQATYFQIKNTFYSKILK